MTFGWLALAACAVLAAVATLVEMPSNKTLHEHAGTNGNWGWRGFVSRVETDGSK